MALNSNFVNNSNTMPPNMPISSGNNNNNGQGLTPEDLNLIPMSKERKSPTLFREKSLQQIAGILISAFKPNALLVGQAGTGKTKIIEELAYLIQNKDPMIPPALYDYEIYNLQLSDIVAGSGIVGELEIKVQNIIDFLSDKNNKAIVFIDEIHQLMSSQTYEKIAQILKPAMSRGKLKVIGATTLQEVSNIDDDPALNRRFTRVIIDELSKEQTAKILLELKASLIKHYGQQFNLDDKLAMLITNIADEFSSVGSHRPDNAITLLDRCLSETIISKQILAMNPNPNIAQSAKSLGLILTEATIKRVAKKIATGNNEPKEIDMEELKNNLTIIKGQDDILEEVLKEINNYKKDLFPKKKPLTFLFCGASGVGKTEIAKILAKSITNEKPIILNMAEFHSSASINRIIGSPAGYVGYDSNTELPFDSLESNPYQIILLDEFEKCDKSVQRLFMDIFDEGYLKTNTNKMIDFSKSVIIATTNAGCTNDASNSIGFASKTSNKPKSKLEDYFDLELIGRFSKKLFFNNIQREIFEEIMKNKYTELVRTIKSNHPTIKLDDDLDDDTLTELTDEIFEPEFGARPIEKRLTEYIYTLV